MSALDQKIRCPNCKNKVIFKKDSYYCSGCKIKILLPFSKTKLKQNVSLGEKIFDYPLLYNFKIIFLNKLNKLKIPINSLVKDKEILDIGCGSYQVRYNPSLPSARVGLDPSVKALQHAQKLYPKSFHVVGSASELPFANKSFDTTLFLFTLHHLSKQDWEKALKEAVRVTRKNIIIYDHIRNDNLMLRSIQLLYWRIFDGGETYPQISEWTNSLKKFKLVKKQRLGSLFSHICFYQLDLSNGK